MATTKQWLPGTRQGQMDMSKNWLAILNANGAGTGPNPGPGPSGSGNADRWGIPYETVQNLAALTDAAEKALAEAKNEETRTRVVNQKVARTFKALVEAMRQLKKRFFHVPPLTEEDVVSLGLTVRDSTHTISGEPTAQVTVETFLVGRSQLGIRLIYVSGDPNDRANKAYRIFYKLVAPGEAAPLRASDFPDSFPERRKNFVRDFEGCSGMTAFFYVRVENGRLIGPAGSITSALIP